MIKTTGEDRGPLIANLTSVFGRLVLEEHEMREGAKVAELKDAIEAGIESGPGVPAQEVFDRLEKKYATKKSRKG